MVLDTQGNDVIGPTHPRPPRGEVKNQYTPSPALTSLLLPELHQYSHLFNQCMYSASVNNELITNHTQNCLCYASQHVIVKARR